MSKRKSKEKRAGRSGKKLDLALKAVIDNMTYSKKEVWAYYKISPIMFDFLSSQAQSADAARLMAAYTNIADSSNEPIEFQTIATSAPIDVAAWHAQVSSIASAWDAPRQFDNFIAEMADHVESMGFTTRTAILALKLGNRGAINREQLNPLEAGFKAAWETVRGAVGNVIKTFDGDVSAAEEARYRSAEEKLYSIVSNSALRAKRMNSRDILLLLKRQLYPAMPTPDLEVDHGNRIGPGDIALETASVIVEKYRHVEITQIIDGQEVTGYRMALSLTKFPRESVYPGRAIPFLHWPERLTGIPFTTYSRGRLIPSEQMKKDVEKRRNEQADQLKNMQASAQKSSDAAVFNSSRISDDMRDLETMDAMLQQSKTPWVEGSYRVVVDAESEEALRELTSRIRQIYTENKITAVVSAGDQLPLFLEEMPGDTLRVKDFRQLTGLSHLATSGFNVYGSVGDPIWGQS